MPFSPFKKSISDPLTSEDLQLLISSSVAEGYFVEYKGVLLAPNKIAKSIASFANTYGGWYIVGVTTDGHNVAQHIVGFSLDDCHDPIASLRDSIRSGIDPIPVFFSQVVTIAPRRAVLLGNRIRHLSQEMVGFIVAFLIALIQSQRLRGQQLIA